MQKKVSCKLSKCVPELTSAQVSKVIWAGKVILFAIFAIYYAKFGFAANAFPSYTVSMAIAGQIVLLHLALLRRDFIPGTTYTLLAVGCLSILRHFISTYTFWGFAFLTLTGTSFVYINSGGFVETKGFHHHVVSSVTCPTFFHGNGDVKKCLQE